MTQDQQQKKAAGRDPNREHMTLSELWQLWRDNLMSWRSFCDEHHDLFTLNIQAGFRRIGRWLSDLRSNARALAAANRDRRFPESEYGAAQLFLFFRGSLEPGRRHTRGLLQPAQGTDLDGRQTPPLF